MSLRTKQALILLLATVLPLITGTAAVNLLVAPAYRRAVSDAAEAETRRVAEQLSWSIAREVARLEKLAAWQDVRALAGSKQYSSSDAQALERQWPQLPPEDPRLSRILLNHVARELQWLRDTDPSIAEIGLTNERGQLVAATNKLEDFDQADEQWWQRAFADGRGRVYISDIRYDPSAMATALDVVVPVYEDGAPGTRVRGVLKLVLNVSQIFAVVERTREAEGGRALIVDGNGKVISFTTPPSELELSEGPSPDLLHRAAAGSEYSSFQQGYLYAWSAIALHTDGDGPAWVMPDLFVVTIRSTDAAIGPLQRVQDLLLWISILTMSAAGLIGYWLADVLMVRQIRSLADGMRELARGDFERAAAIADRLLRDDGPQEQNSHAQDRDAASPPETTLRH